LRLHKFFAVLVIPTALTAFGASPKKPYDFNGFMVGVQSVETSTEAAPTQPAFESSPHLIPMFKARVPRGAAPFEESAPPPAVRQWLFLKPFQTESAPAAAEQNPWDTAHDIVDHRRPDLLDLRESAAKPTANVIVEPNIIYYDPDQPEEAEATLPAATEGASTGNTIISGSSPQWPTGTRFAWHLGADFTQLDDARKAAAPAFSADNKVLIAHLDTGSDAAPDDLTPSGFQPGQSLNFVLNENPTAFQDRSGHGTGTLSVLAGRAVTIQWNGATVQTELGGAPLANVVEYRIGSRVIHVFPVAMANAIATAADSGIDVISMSAGGAPSIALRDAVDKAYDAGVAMFFASGDFWRLFPSPFYSTPSTTVYPARFAPVMSVCGATEKRRSYADDPGLLSLLFRSRRGSWYLRGSRGPLHVMEHSIAAFTPNIARHHASAPANAIDLDFSGTSASTPQVAAAAALWLQFHRDEPELKGVWRRWEKAQSVYDALSATADNRFRGYSKRNFGAGLLHANDALAHHYDRPKRHADPARIGFDWVTIAAVIIAPSDLIKENHREMLQTEVAQMVMSSKKLHALLGDGDELHAPDHTAVIAMREALRNDSRASRYLRNALGGKTLKPSQSAEVRVRAHSYWNDSEITVAPGQRYRIEVLDPSRRWIDFFIRSGAASYTSWLTSWDSRNLRNGNVPFFAAMATTGDETTAQPVVAAGRTSLDLAVQTHGRIRLYANDVPGFYWNNFGSLMMKITRLN
jgi:hypothetical protein